MTDQTLTPQFTTASPANQNAGVTASFDVPRVLKRAVQAVSRRLRRRRDRAHLSELPDYLLEDIGLTRADVPAKPPVGEGWR